MPPPSPRNPKRIVLEKSRTVRRRYQRSNKRLEFSASQIARIEREEEREKRAKKLREREKKRIANKKKKAEKEAREREERRRLGLPDQHALPVPSSQPLLSRFLMKKTEKEEEEEEARRESVGDEDEDTEREGEDSLESFVLEEEESLFSDLDDLSDDTIIAGIEEGVLPEGDGATEEVAASGCCEGQREKDDDEFSDCSVFYDEELIKEADTMATARDSKESKAETPSVRPPPIGLPLGDSFQDDTAYLLEEFAHEIAHEFDTDEEFERELVQLDAV